MLILIMGLPGSGKTYFAKALAKKIGGIHFNSDIIRKQQELVPEYSESRKSRVYRDMFQQVCEALREQHVVVVDATFSLRQYRAPYLNFAKENRIPLKVIMVTADESCIFQRLQHSRPDSDADFNVYKKIEAEFEPIDMEYLKLKSDQYSLDTLLEQGISHLAANTP